MAMGTIDRTVLGAIADAIRAQAGTAARLLPGEMAAAVAALNGERAGEAESYPAGDGRGLVDDAVFAAIAEAIRAQNGLTKTYTPPEMAGAILALTWDTGLRARALLLSDGTLEFNYRDGRSSDVAGASVLKCWEVDPAGYGSGGKRPWDGDKLAVTRAVFDGDFAQAGVASTAYWFLGCANMLSVEGFEALAGVADMRQMFTSCAKLETIHAEGFGASSATGALMFSGCNRLVGGNGYVALEMDGPSKLTYDGVLTDPVADAREWFYGHAYADGELVLTAAAAPEAGRAVLASGRHCANASYGSVGSAPWYGARADVTRVSVAADMAGFTRTHASYWFYGMREVAEVSGLANLSNVGDMLHTFNSCSSIGELDLRGLDPSGLTKLTHTFSGCSSLTTIIADAGWELPRGVSGVSTFYSCAALVGGNGTAYDSKSVGAGMMRIDKEGQAGYLTAG